MKKTAYLLLLFCAIQLSAQCTITGKSSITISEEATYSVPNESAQCKDCYQWTNLGSNASITGDVRQNSLKIKAISGGRQIVSVTILTPQGISTCSKTVDIIDNSKIATDIPTSGAVVSPTPVENTCDVTINNFKEVKVGDGVVSFFPNSAEDTYKYNWTVTYGNGDIKSSKEKIPQFPFSKANGINTVKISISSSKCMKEFTKTYDSNFWNFF